MTMNGPAYEALLNAKAKYEADGYAVSVKERLPKPFECIHNGCSRSPRRPSSWSSKSSQLSMSDGARHRLERLKKTFADECGWRLDVVTYEREGPPPAPDLEQREPSSA